MTQHLIQLGRAITEAAATGLDAKRAAEARTLLKSKFRPPFSQSGNWVNDSRGTSVCEMTPDVAKAIAVALNAFVTTT